MHRLYPTITKKSATQVLGTCPVTPKVFDKRIVTAQRFSPSAVSERGELFPGMLSIEPGGVRGFLVLDLGIDNETISLADSPIEPKETLGARTFPAKPLYPDIISLLDHFHPVFRADRAGIVASGGVPNREKHDFTARIAQLLDAEISGAPAAGHEIGTINRFLH